VQSIVCVTDSLCYRHDSLCDRHDCLLNRHDDALPCRHRDALLMLCLVVTVMLCVIDGPSNASFALSYRLSRLSLFVCVCVSSRERARERAHEQERMRKRVCLRVSL